MNAQRGHGSDTLSRGRAGRAHHTGRARGNHRRGGVFNQRGDSREHVSSHSDGQLNAHLRENFKTQSRQRANYEDGDSRRLIPTFNPHVAKYAREQESVADLVEKDDWRSIPEIPSASELLLDKQTTVVLPRNKIDMPWTKRERYLKTHYKLLREDATASLREALDKFREDSLRMDDHETRIYEQVHIRGFTFTHKGIAARIKFSTVRAGSKILWANSKRLTSGSLVILSSDEFKSECIPAVVAARPLQNLESTQPEIDIFFSECENIEVDSQKAFVMVEASQGYFEAYRHTLLALQKQSTESFPLSNHICALEQNIDAPEYLKTRPHRDLSFIVPIEVQHDLSQVNILEQWPSTSECVLDKSQWSAMRQLLTKRLAIIQGPPGTGKTYVSKIALEILVNNRSTEDPPIVVACQTNHALDQLLLLTSTFDPTYIRLGGRSTNPDVKKRALYEVRLNDPVYDVPGSCYAKANRDLRLETVKLKSILRFICEKEGAGTSPPLAASDLEELGVISSEQRQSLEKGASQWVRSDESGQEEIQMWLGKSLSPFQVVYTEDNFGFEAIEEDLEMEQLQELEAEHGITDEEDLEMLKGESVTLSSGWTMAKPSQNTTDQVKRMLDTQLDLWRVPEHLRGPMYLLMQNKAKRVIKLKFCEAAKSYTSIAKQLQIGKWERDVIYLQKANIIGCTTSGLAKYRNLLSSLRSKILLIEEASEVLEGAVTVGCMESLQLLILVGDHLQLQASCSVRELAGDPYWLNISLFERLVRNQIPHKTLLRQRRMDPDFRRLIYPVYPELEDHESVVDRPIVPWGTGQVRSYFFNHQFQELQDESMSTFNEYEARMVAKFYRHLIRNGVPPAAITVLTFYNGQRKKILRALKNDEETMSSYNKVKTVDSYQGEENHIIILSLVRCNDYNKIGFLDINNRIVVALSRAKYGFYLFGNGGFLADHNELWDAVEQRMYENGLSGTRLPITCTNHGKTLLIENPEDFDDINGGCKQPCSELLHCGHTCSLKCHPYSHDRVLCREPCQRKLTCKHTCNKQCHEMCACDCEAFEEHRSHEATNITPDILKSIGSKPAKQQNVVSINTTTRPLTSMISRTNHWEDYATNGGVEADDERRAKAHQAAQKASDSIVPYSTQVCSSAALDTSQRPTVRGRTKYVQTYQPAAPETDQLPRALRSLNINEQSCASTKFCDGKGKGKARD